MPRSGSQSEQFERARRRAAQRGRVWSLIAVFVLLGGMIALGAVLRPHDPPHPLRQAVSPAAQRR